VTIRDFAARTGVTVKTLLHYDRLRLLQPPRTAGGHRLYDDRHERRLRRILALKRLGIGLKRMAPILDADPATLRRFLSGERDRLTEERARLGRALDALALVDESLASAPDEEGVSRLADMLEMPTAVGEMKRYFDEETWSHARTFYDDWPSAPWIALGRDAAALSMEAGGRRIPGAHPALETDLRRRYNELALAFWREMPVDRDLRRRLHEGFARAWRDRDRWPEVMKRRFNVYGISDIAAVIEGR
jgi:DNA-binding transcriptional MerR regulator